MQTEKLQRAIHPVHGRFGDQALLRPTGCRPRSPGRPGSSASIASVASAARPAAGSAFRRGHRAREGSAWRCPCSRVSRASSPGRWSWPSTAAGPLTLERLDANLGAMTLACGPPIAVQRHQALRADLLLAARVAAGASSACGLAAMSARRRWRPPWSGCRSATATPLRCARGWLFPPPPSPSSASL